LFALIVQSILTANDALDAGYSYICCVMPPQTKARSQVLRFGGKYILGGKRFCFYCMFKANFSWQNKFWGSTTRECSPWLQACHRCVTNHFHWSVL